MSNHPWCSNIARDTAIRAAEDAAASERPPLPDHRELPERVARLECSFHADTTEFRKALAKCSEKLAELDRRSQILTDAAVAETLSADARTEETSQSGLRTERVTLEVVGWKGQPTASQLDRLMESMMGVGILSMDKPSSVRVVPSDEADAEVERLRAERDRWCAQSGLHEKAANALKARVAELEAQLSRSGKNGPSDGDSDAKCTERESSADAEPVAWGVDVDDEIHSVIHGRYRDFADDAAHRVCGTVVPLFRAPPPPRGWLTERDRQTMIAAAVFCSGRGEKGISEALEWILARNSPPRVRLPRSINVEGPGALSWHEMRRAVTEALAAAGVEVGNE